MSGTEICPKCGSQEIYDARRGSTIICPNCSEVFLESKIYYDPIKCFYCRVEFTPKDDKWSCPDCQEKLNNDTLKRSSPEFFSPKTQRQWELLEVNKGEMDMEDVAKE